MRNLLILMKQIIRKILSAVIPKWLKAFYRNIKIIAKKIYAFTIYKKSDKRNIFIIGSPSHGNGGDIAIAIAQKKMLQDNFPDDNIYDVDGSEYYNHYKAIKRICKINDLFAFIGGGNFGNQYMLEESIRRHLVEHFPKNKIVMFPQSIYYVNGELGEKEKQITHDIFLKHKHLILSARDKYSFEMMKEYFPEHKVLLIPDVVLYLRPNIKEERNGVLICLRKDLEGILTTSQRNMIEAKLKSVFSKINHTDTWVDYKNNKAERETLLNNKLKEFASSDLIITDRIHGMIFAAITGTSCIVLSNYNHKVKGAFEWIKDLSYIKYANDVEEVLKYINVFKNNLALSQEDVPQKSCVVCQEVSEVVLKKYEYKNKFNSYYKQLIEACRE